MQPVFRNKKAWGNFKKEAESWLGTPYVHWQANKSRGADCTLFLGELFYWMGALKKLDYGYYPQDWHLHTQDELVLAGVVENIRNNLASGYILQEVLPGKKFMRGDWISFSTSPTGVSNHCALVWEEKQLLHSIEGRGVSFTPFGRYWKERMTLALRFYKE